MLFTGPIRANLSPFGLHSDAELWAVLRRAHLAPVVSAWPGGLDHALSEGGAPLSAGQRQLLALARALLKPSKVRALFMFPGWASGAPAPNARLRIQRPYAGCCTACCGETLCLEAWRHET